MKDSKTINMLAAGRRLRDLRGIRSRRGVVNEMRSEGIRMSYSALACYENGVRTPKPETRQSLADYYGVPVEYIFSA